jgi:hypothetical protein
MRPMLGRKVIGGEQDFFIFLQAFAGLIDNLTAVLIITVDAGYRRSSLQPLNQSLSYVIVLHSGSTF